MTIRHQNINKINGQTRWYPFSLGKNKNKRFKIIKIKNKKEEEEEKEEEERRKKKKREKKERRMLKNYVLFLLKQRQMFLTATTFCVHEYLRNYVDKSYFESLPGTVQGLNTILNSEYQRQ